MPFVNGIRGNEWLEWFRKRRSEPSLKTVESLEQTKGLHLCEENVRSFYVNLQEAFKAHQYTLERIWNCDENEANASKSGNGLIIAKNV